MNEEVLRYIKALRKEVDSLLRTKTGWGRNELKIALEQAYTSALMASIEKGNKKKLKVDFD